MKDSFLQNLYVSDKKNIFIQFRFSENYNLFSILFIFFSLLLLSSLNLYSANQDIGHFKQHMIHVVLGSLCFFAAGWFFSLRTVINLSYPLFFLHLVGLILVFVFGYQAGGAQRWLHLGFFRFQPSESMKLAIIIFVAKFFYTNKKLQSYVLSDLWFLIASILFVFTLIFKQPDFGTAGLCLMIFVFQLAFVDIVLSRKVIVITFLSSVAMSIFSWFFLLHSYQKMRILNLIYPKLDPSGSGYNSLQSLVAIGSGGFWGKGYLNGTQTQLRFLPAKDTDFIFSVFAEEQGFVGSMLLFSLMFWLFFLGLKISRESHDIYSALTSIGITIFLFLEFVINVAMVLGLFPVVGMPFPFFSYGGSSLLTVCGALGLLISIDRWNHNIDNSLMKGLGL